MLRRPISLFLIAAALALLLAAGASAAPGVAKEDLKDIMPLSQLKVGMKGYGLTVFRGTTIEKFDVEILGILRKVNNGKDLILVRASGGPISGRGANIIQGMSGSPVYVEGKVIGAVSYSLGYFSKEPLGMLTPIEDMLDALDPKLPSRPSGLSSPVSTPVSPIRIGGKMVTRVQIRDPMSAGSAPDGTLVMTPLMTPLMVSGMSLRGIAKLAEILQPYGIAPMAGPGAKADSVPVELKPGAALGLSLATGDIDMTAVGTLTYRRGNKIVAFGHPLLGLGPIDAPMTTAYVHDVFPSLQVSSKIASPMKVVGHIFQDRPWSVAGEVGKAPKTIPITIDVDDAVIGRKCSLHINVLGHPVLVTRLLVLISAEGMAETHGLFGDAMAAVKLQIDADQVGKIVRENVYFDAESIETAALDDLQGLLSILTNNRFYPLDVKAVHISVRIESGRKTAAIERIFVDKSKYEPGEAIDVGVELRPYKASKIVKTVRVVVPEGAPDGRMTLQVRGGMGGAPEGMAMISIGGDSGGPRMIGASGGAADNIRQMIDKYLERERNDELVARLVLPGGAVSVAGEKLDRLPDPIAGVFKSPKSSVVRLERQEVKSVERTGYIPLGEQSLQIRVERRRMREKKPSPQPPEPQAPSETTSAPPAPPVEADQGDEDQTEDILGTSSGLPIELAAPAPPAPSGERKPAKPPSPTPPALVSPTSERKPESKPAEKPEQQAAEKPVGRQPTTWRQKSLQDFALGAFNGTAATSADDIRLAPAIAKLAALPEGYVWCVTPDGQGGAFAGTGNNGLVYRISKDGPSAVFFKTGELEVHSLARNSKGVLYAGTSPHGKVYRIDADGKGEVAFDAPEKYILALAIDSKDNVYAGVGDGGIIYRLTPAGEAKPFARLTESSVLALTVDKSDNLYAGTARDGILYKITPDGTIAALYDAAEDSITSVAVDRLGNIYAGTGSGKGNIYKIPVSGAPKAVFDKAPRALSMAIDAQNSLYAVSDDQIFKIMADETVMSLDTRRAGAQFIALAVDADGTIFAGTANTGAVYRSSGASDGTYQSAVHDAGLPSKWGTIGWIADAPQGTSLTFQTRTGNAAEPDGSWSGWSPAYSSASGQPITSPPARYIQYRATLGAQAGSAPVVKQVSVAYLTENRPPKITVSEPQQGAAVAKTLAIKWTGSDPDKDSLTYDLYYSADAGKTWQALGSGLKQSKGAEAAPGTTKEPEKATGQESPANEDTDTGAPDARDMLAQLKTELDQHPEIPQEVKDKMLAEAPGAIEKSVDAASKPAEEPTEEETSGPGAASSTKQTSHNWDTTKVPDGSYLIKVVASDRVSNAVGSLTDEKVVGPVTVANKPPRVVAFQKSLKVNPDGTAKVDGYAYDNLVPLAGVQYKVDTGDWMAAAADDGIFDSPSEAFTITTQALAKGKHTIEVKAINAAGSSATAKVTADVP